MIPPHVGAEADVSIAWVRNSRWIRVEWPAQPTGIYTPTEAFDLAESLRITETATTDSATADALRETARELKRACNEVANA